MESDNRSSNHNLSEAQTPAYSSDEYAVQNYPRLLQLARAGLVPEDMVSKMTYILKDPKRFGVSPKIRNDLYDLMIKTLNYIVVSDPAAWARFRNFLMDEETHMADSVEKFIIEELRKAVPHSYRTIRLVSERYSAKPGEVWDSGASWAAMAADGTREYFSKEVFGEPEAKERAEKYAKGELTRSEVKAEKGLKKQENIRTAAKKARASGKAIPAKTADPDFDGPDSKEGALGSSPETEKKVATYMDRIAQSMANMVAGGKSRSEAEKAIPEFDLCTVTVPGTNLYCEDDLGIKRNDMPQLKTKARTGTPAEELLKKQNAGKAKPSDEVDAEGVFVEHLRKKGVKVEEGKSMAATAMKATQRDLVGAKVAGMINGLKEGRKKREADACEGIDPATKKTQCKNAEGNCGNGNCKDEGLLAPLLVSKDGYVLDGHHRWAAIATLDLMDGKREPYSVNTTVIDMDMEDLVDESNKWGTEFGLERKTGVAKTEKKEEYSLSGSPLQESITQAINKILLQG